jgi:aspartate kinase
MATWSIFKFGGASVKDAVALRNAIKVVREHGQSPLVIVVSAMGKTTNALEAYLQQREQGFDAEAAKGLEAVMAYHAGIAQEVGIWTGTLEAAVQAEWQRIAALDTSTPYGQRYDATVSAGEVVSSLILQAALQSGGLEVGWVDARKVVKTNADHRRAIVDWEATESAIAQALPDAGINVTQGFIASGPKGQITTLGREGSDYSAAIFAYALHAGELTIWKDVPGVLSGDPKVFGDVELLREIPYTEAIELAFYGASVIHPKTIQPLQGRNIVLHVRSFLDPSLPATRIANVPALEPLVPCWIQKSNQVVFTVGTRDLSFLSEGHLAEVYRTFSDAGLLVNLAQHAAVSSRFCVTADRIAVPKAFQALEARYRVMLEEGLCLYTVRRPHEAARQWLQERGELRFEQRSGLVDQVVLKETIS